MIRPILRHIKSPHEILQVPLTASQQEIKQAYYKLAKKYHPDIDKTNSNKFQELNQAYQILTRFPNVAHCNSEKNYKEREFRQQYYQKMKVKQQQRYERERVEIKAYLRRQYKIQLLVYFSVFFSVIGVVYVTGAQKDPRYPKEQSMDEYIRQKARKMRQFQEFQKEYRKMMKKRERPD